MPEINIWGMDPLRLALTPRHAGVADYVPGSSFGPRTLADFEFVWLIAGDARWHPDGADLACPEGSVLLARPGSRDAYTWDPERQTRHGFIHFTVEDAGGLPPVERWPLVVEPRGDDVLRPLLRHCVLLSLAGDPSLLPLAANALRQALAVFVLGRWTLQHEAVAADEHPVVERAMAAVREAWSDGVLRPLSLDELAAAADVTPGHLIRVFRASYDATPQEALRILRLERAATMLARSNDAVQDIAERCGFESPFHFSRRFKAAYGRSPRHFRDWVRNGGDVGASPLMRARRLHMQLLMQ